MNMWYIVTVENVFIIKHIHIPFRFFSTGLIKLIKLKSTYVQF